MTDKRTDDELDRQLEKARTSGGTVEFVIKLRHAAGKVPDPDDIKAKTDSAIARACKATGEKPHDVNVLGRVGVAYVSASEAFARELIGAPEVSSAMANQRDEGSAAT